MLKDGAANDLQGGNEKRLRATDQKCLHKPFFSQRSGECLASVNTFLNNLKIIAHWGSTSIYVIRRDNKEAARDSPPKPRIKKKMEINTK